MKYSYRVVLGGSGEETAPVHDPSRSGVVAAVGHTAAPGLRVRVRDDHEDTRAPGSETVVHLLQLHKEECHAASNESEVLDTVQ